MDVVRHQPNQGWIEVIVGSMFSGKSEELIRRLRRAQIARQKVQIFKPKLDTRYGDDHIVSHSEMRILSVPVASSRELLERVEPDTEVVGIDEGQFFDLELPTSLLEHVVDLGRELGGVADELAGERDVRSRQGTWGLLTRGLVDRTRSFELALLNALAPFYNAEGYA